MSSDTLRNYYVYEYVYDPVSEGYTAIEGEIQGYVKAANPFDACQKLGFTDYNQHFAKEIVDLNKHSEGIKKEQKHLNKVSKQLTEMIKERDAEIESFKKDRPCPNCGKKMDENYVCAGCGFGVEEPEDEDD